MRKNNRHNRIYTVRAAVSLLLALLLAGSLFLSGCVKTEPAETSDTEDTASAQDTDTQEPDTDDTEPPATDTDTETEETEQTDTGDTGDTETEDTRETSSAKKERLTPGLYTITEPVTVGEEEETVIFGDRVELYSPSFGILFLGDERYGISWTNSSLIIEDERCGMEYADRTLKFRYRNESYEAHYYDVLPYSYDPSLGGIGNYAKSADKYVSLYRDGSGIYKTDGEANVIYWGRYEGTGETYMILGSSLGTMIIDNENGKLRFEIKGDPHDGYKRSTAEHLGMVFGTRETAPGISASDPDAVFENTGLVFTEPAAFRLGSSEGEALSYNNHIRFYPTNEEGTEGFGIIIVQGKLTGLTYKDNVLTISREESEYSLSEDGTVFEMRYVNSDYSFTREASSQRSALDGLGYKIGAELVCVDSGGRKTGVKALFREDGTIGVEESEEECRYGYLPETGKGYILTGSVVKYEIISYKGGVLEVKDSSGRIFRFMPEDMVPAEDDTDTETAEPDTGPVEKDEPDDTETDTDTEPVDTEPPEVLPGNGILLGYGSYTDGMYYVDYGDLRIPVPENFDYDVAYDGNPLFISPEGCAIKFTITYDPDGYFYSIDMDSYYNEYSAYYPGFRGIYDFETGWIDGVEAKAVQYGVTFYEYTGNYDATIIHLIMYANGYMYSVTYTDTYGTYGDIYVRAINNIDYKFY